MTNKNKKYNFTHKDCWFNGIRRAGNCKGSVKGRIVPGGAICICDKHYQRQTGHKPLLLFDL